MNWSLYFPLLIFAHNATPNGTTGFQPYQLMFVCKVPTVSDAWVELANYNDQFSLSKCAWINEKCHLILSVNRHALRGGKYLPISTGNMVLLWHHPDSCNKF